MQEETLLKGPDDTRHGVYVWTESNLMLCFT